ncbi:major facilitator superfamily domain-containing protein 9 isoform X2 [Lingula anatina]|uniref:Major facilitator superfamily domain-containing protein 9 isoform X2 n=1 Tax=Lingula anatina TaxID=7574 RepID=A0A1S3ITJ0_LINAN|nr:major facilitator superfamily domain-containing protein 9 isoform X2 [Lingula anatina]|eukprot:XP_013401517.1 major facilitator superfamily domain-containing protein 9 isoform X2 [Lingula anatina]
MLYLLTSDETGDTGKRMHFFEFILSSLYGSLQFISGPVLGKWSDVSGHRHALILCLILSAFGYFLLGFSYSLVFVFLARIPIGIFKHSRTITKAYITDIVPKDHQSATFGRFNAVCSIGFILGPPVGGHIAELPGGFQLAAMLAGGIFLLNAGMLWFCVPEVNSKLKSVASLEVTATQSKLDNNNEETTKSLELQPKVRRVAFSPSKLLYSFKYIDWRNLWDIFLIRLTLGIGTLLYKNHYALFLKARFSASPSTVGYMMSYSAIASACTGFVIGNIADWYKDDRKLLLHSTFMMFISFTSTVFVPDLFWLLIIVTPLAFSTAISRICVTSLTIQKGHRHDSGVLLGLGQSFTAMGRIISPTLASLSSEISVVAPNVISAACSFIVFILMVILSRKKQVEVNEKIK